MDRIVQNLREVNSKLTAKESKEIANACYREWDVNQREVQANFN